MLVKECLVPRREVLTDGHPDRADHHADKAILWFGVTALGMRTLHVVFLQPGHDGECDTQTNPHGDERQTDEAVVPLVVAAEDDGITEEEGILYAYDE